MCDDHYLISRQTVQVYSLCGSFLCFRREAKSGQYGSSPTHQGNNIIIQEHTIVRSTVYLAGAWSASIS